MQLISINVPTNRFYIEILSNEFSSLLSQLSVQRDLLRFAQVFSQMIHVSVPLRIQNVRSIDAKHISDDKVINMVAFLLLSLAFSRYWPYWHRAFVS